jgi:hypothetical protein
MDVYSAVNRPMADGPGHLQWIRRCTITTLVSLTSNGYKSKSASFDVSGHCISRLRDGRLLCGQNPVGKNWGPRTPLILSISDNEGQTWRHWITLEDAPPAAEFEKVLALETGIVSDGVAEFSYAAAILAYELKLIWISYPCLAPTMEDDVDGVWVTYTWQRRGLMACKIWE